MKTIKDLCKEYGYSQTRLAKRFGIPLRTVQDWCRELRTPPPYIVTMLEEILKASEVAREIFEEIENAHDECIHIDATTNIGYLLQTKFLNKLAELKKKYQ